MQRSTASHKPPRLPARGPFGRVCADDWSKLEADPAKFGAEGLQLRTEAVAGRVSGVSQIRELIVRSDERRG